MPESFNWAQHFFGCGMYVGCSMVNFHSSTNTKQKLEEDQYG